MPAIIDADGIQIKTLSEIRDDILAYWKSAPPAGLGLDITDRPGSRFYQLATSIAAEMVETYELAESVYDSFNRSAADGVQLDNVGALIGVPRNAATKATGYARCVGTLGTTIPDYLDATPGVIADPTTGLQVNILPEPTGVGWVIPAGLYVDVQWESVLAGETTIAYDQLTQIVNPVAGWTSVNNPAAAGATVQGVDIESDSDYRIRQEQSGAILGGCTDPSIRAKLLDIDEVEAAVVISNRTLTADATTGQAAKSFWALVYPGGLSSDVEEEILETIYLNMPAGIESWSGFVATSVTGTVTDDQGYEVDVAYSYGDDVEMAADVTIYTKTVYPADLEDQVRDAIDTYITGLKMGESVYPAPLLGIIGDLTGVKNIELQIKKKADLPMGVWPVDSTTIDMELYEKAVVTTPATDIVVTLV